MIISIDVEKHLASIKCKQKKACSITKATYEKPTANIIFNGNKTESFSSKIRNKMFMPFLLNIVSDVLSSAIMQEKENKTSKLERKKQNYLCLQKTIIYVETPKQLHHTHTHTNLLELISKLSKITGYKINTSNQLHFHTLTMKNMEK